MTEAESEKIVLTWEKSQILIVGMFIREEFFIRNPLVCEMFGAFTLAIATADFFTMVVVSINRYDFSFMLL